MSWYLDCATAKGVEQHLRDGESCQICKDWMKAVGAKIVKGKVIAPPPPKIQTVTKVAKAKKTRGEYNVELKPCGTSAAYIRHRRRGEKPCKACAKANAKQSQEARAKLKKHLAENPLNPSQLYPQCGTRNGAVKHRKLGEEKCDACKKAEREYNRESYHKNKKQGRGQGYRRMPREHGTARGYSQHYNDGTQPCDACKEAYNKAGRDKYRAKAIEKFQAEQATK